MLIRERRRSIVELAVRRIERADGIDVVAGRVRAAAHDAFVDPPAVDRLLGGAWLGHRVHPLAAQAPLGAWLMATLLDRTGSDEHAAAVDALLLTGCLSALPTAITGAHDLATTSGSQTRVALVHAITMDATLGLFVAALVKRRRGDRRAARRLGSPGPPWPARAPTSGDIWSSGWGWVSMSVEPTHVAVPPSVDRRILQSYLSDHLTGAASGRARALKMSEWYADREIGPELAEVARQIDEEHGHLGELIDALDLRRGLPLQALARVGELVGRARTNGRVLTRSPMTPLLELELLRAAVNGKQGLWQVLAEYAEELGLDAADCVRRAADADRQGETLERLHAEIRPDALRPT